MGGGEADVEKRNALARIMGLNSVESGLDLGGERASLTALSLFCGAGGRAGTIDGQRTLRLCVGRSGAMIGMAGE